MEKLIYILLVTLSFTSISFFKIGMAEFTIFHGMVAIVIFFKSFIALKINKFDVKIPRNLLLAAVFLSLVNLFSYPNIKISSFIFSLIIIVEIILIYNCLRFLSVNQVIKIVKTIILLYFINLSLSSIFIAIGFQPPSLLGEIFQIYYFDNRIRPYGFADEPSYAAIILVFSLFVLFKNNNFKYIKSEFIWYAMTVVAILLTGSTYGYILLGFVLGYFLLNSNVVFIQIAAIIRSHVFTKKQFVMAFIIAASLFISSFQFVNLENNKSVQRIVKLYTSLTSSERSELGTIQKLSRVDGSASMRFVPTIRLIENFDESDWNEVLFGRGAGRSVGFFTEIYRGNTTVLGFIPAFVYNYGVFGTTLFFLFFIALFPKRKFLLMFLFLLFIFNADFNTQIFVYVLFTIMAVKKIEMENENLKRTLDSKN